MPFEMYRYRNVAVSRPTVRAFRSDNGDKDEAIPILGVVIR